MVAPSTTAPTAVASGLCPDLSSNNIAEFYGFRECLRRALRGAVCSHLVFELDSMLVVMFMLGMWDATATISGFSFRSVTT